MKLSHWNRRRAVAAMLASAGAATLDLWTLQRVHAQAVREINIIAQRFKFTPNEIGLTLGQPVLLLIRSLDYIHGFNVPDLGIRSDLMPGQVTRLSLTPRQVGRLDFLCDNFCGDGHETMHGHFNVTE